MYTSRPSIVLAPPPQGPSLPNPMYKHSMVFQVAEDQRYALLEYVSHLTAKDYEATLNDLIVLGFIPREIGDDPEKVRHVQRNRSNSSLLSRISHPVREK